MVAARAGVTVQTVIRHFRSKEELFGKVAWEAAAQESARRAEAVPGAVRDATIRAARQAIIALHLDDWANSSELQPPT